MPSVTSNPDAGSDGTSKGIRVFREKENPVNLHLFRNMFPEDFLRLLVHSTAIVGNSSVALRECSFLGVPAVNIGTRQIGRERGANVIDVDHDRQAINDGIREHIRRGRAKPDSLYGDGRSGQRIADCLATAELTVDKMLTY
jgi:UDP-N-acetylglucosamine 2-epimerase